jgi:hypothetical protein
VFEKGTLSRLDGCPPMRSLPHPVLPIPDAPFRPLGKVMLRLFHLLVLFALVCLVAWILVCKPALQYLRGDRKLVTVRIIAKELQNVPAPTEGLYVGRPLPHGVRVSAGQLLGKVLAPQLDREIAARADMLETLLQRQLLQGQSWGESDSPDLQAAVEKESRDLALRIRQTTHDLKRLQAIQKELVIRSPVNGQLHGGKNNSLTVRTHDTVAQVWPEGGDLLVEVEGPLGVINELVATDHLKARFATPAGEVTVTAKPIPCSVRPFMARPYGQEERIWAVLQCSPLRVPAIVRYPGPIGRLP